MITTEAGKGLPAFFRLGFELSSGLLRNFA
jgi:hypothetical protein